MFPPGFLHGNPAFSYQINVDVRLLQVGNFVQYPEQHSHQHNIIKKGHAVGERTDEGKGNGRECS